MKVRKDIDTLKTFNVAHTSYYQLTIEPGTMFISMYQNYLVKM